jgi:hypothetical protein
VSKAAYTKNHTTTLRLDDCVLVRLQRMVAENPLYSNARGMRGALGGVDEF